MHLGKFFHIAGIPGRQADNLYFVSAVRETQKWGKYIYLDNYVITYISLFSFVVYNYR